MLRTRDLVKILEKSWLSARIISAKAAKLDRILARSRVTQEELEPNRASSDRDGCQSFAMDLGISGSREVGDFARTASRTRYLVIGGALQDALS